MLDPKLLRNQLNIVAKKLESRGFKLDVDKIRKLEDCRKTLQIQVENLQAKRNSQSKSIGIKKNKGENIKFSYLDNFKLNEELNKVKSELEILQLKIRNFSLLIPNLPDDSVLVGKNEKDNIEIKRWGNPRKFNFKVRDHVTLGKMHDGLNFNDASKITGSNFVIIQNQIAQLYRALGNFMMDLHTNFHGYKETYVPYLVNQNSLYGTGQLPKFTDDLFHINSIGKINNNHYALIPTAEVPLTNLVSNKILEEDNLPIKLVAYSPCFRSEAGSYGRNNHGLIRMHQFDKVEMVQIVRPEDSSNTLEEITSQAEKVLELLKLPYRRMFLCTGDMGFSACKAYDLEVWSPAQNMYFEISSCSNVWDFQARRMQTRFKNKLSKKTRLVHTLNGSGLAIGRTLIAVLENYQQLEGYIEIPEVLRPYMKWQRYIG